MTPAPRAKDVVAWAALYVDRVAGAFERLPIFRTKKAAKAWARDTHFRIARVRITEIREDTDG